MTAANAKPNRVSTLIGTCITPAVLECAGLASEQGLDTFYRSETFELLSNPSTGMWHLSAPTIAEVLRRELDSGELDIPEEQS